MRSKVSGLRYKRNASAWKHLHNILASGRRNRGRLIFMLRGFIKVHKPETWCDDTVGLFARFAKVGNPDSFAERIATLLVVFKKISTDHTRMVVEMMRSFEASRMNDRKINKGGRLNEFGEIGVIRTIADELEVSYGPWSKIAA